MTCIWTLLAVSFSRDVCCNLLDGIPIVNRDGISGLSTSPKRDGQFDWEAVLALEAEDCPLA